MKIRASSSDIMKAYQKLTEQTVSGIGTSDSGECNSLYLTGANLPPVTVRIETRQIVKRDDGVYVAKLWWALPYWWTFTPTCGSLEVLCRAY